jgi:hypothetical protein
MIEAEMAAAKADLMAHRANNDVESASASVQQIANLEAERANLNTLYQNYVQSQQPPAPEQLTDEERNARPWHKMTPDDGWRSPARRNMAAASTGMTQTSEAAGTKLSAAGSGENEHVRRYRKGFVFHAHANVQNRS